MSEDALWECMLEMIEKKGVNSQSIKDSEEFKDIFKRINETFNLEFNPSASVIASIVSQEIIKVITLKDFPGHGMFVYSSITQNCTME
jgi:hypothetical protein